MSEKIVVTGAARTPIGKFMGSYKGTHVADLGAVTIQEAIERSGIALDQVDEVCMGNVIQAGLGENPARQASIYAGVPQAVPAWTLNTVCGSGMKAITTGAQSILSGETDVYVAGGMENMSRGPYVAHNMREGARLGDVKMVDEVTSQLTDVFNQYHMGITAENLAEKYGISREQQDEFAVMSQARTRQAVESGRFDDEIVPVEVKERRKTRLVERDEHYTPDCNMEVLAKLRPAFKPDGGTVTAANASGINDGAAATVLMSESKAKDLGSKPIAELVAWAYTGCAPEIMGIGPVYAIQKVLGKTGMSLADMDLIELNEAFAAQSLSVARGLEEEGIGKLNLDITNVNGGAIGLGHPVGCSGTRIVVTLLHEMQKRNLELGLASLCIGGGMGIATIWRML